MERTKVDRPLGSSRKSGLKTGKAGTKYFCSVAEVVDSVDQELATKRISVE